MPHARSPRRTRLPLDAVRIGHLDGDWYDPRCTWLRQRAIGPDGALLVRPDRFVAWRNSEASAGPTGRARPRTRAGPRADDRDTAAVPSELTQRTIGDRR